MSKNTLGNFLSFPLIIIAIPFISLGFLIKYGLEDTVYILEGLNKLLKEKRK